MRFIIAVAALAAAVSAGDARCSEWKISTYESKASTEGWTKQVNEQNTTYFDKNGKEITDWKSFEGHDANCVPHNPDAWDEFEISPEMLHTLYWILAVVVGVIACAVVLYLCCKKNEGDPEEVKEGFVELKEKEVQEDNLVVA